MWITYHVTPIWPFVLHVPISTCNPQTSSVVHVWTKSHGFNMFDPTFPCLISWAPSSKSQLVEARFSRVSTTRLCVDQLDQLTWLVRVPLWMDIGQHYSCITCLWPDPSARLMNNCLWVNKGRFTRGWQWHACPLIIIFNRKLNF